MTDAGIASLMRKRNIRENTVVVVDVTFSVVFGRFVSASYQVLVLVACEFLMGFKICYFCYEAAFHVNRCPGYGPEYSTATFGGEGGEHIRC